MKPGIYPGMSRAEYEQIPAVNYSTLKYIARSPAHYMQALACPAAPTDDQALGTLIHTVCLAKEATLARFAVAPKCDRRTKAGKEEYAAFVADSAGKTVVYADDLAIATSIRAALERHPTVGPMLYGTGVQYEVVVVWGDPETGILCKAMIDALADSQLFFDLKSAKDASPGGFGRDAAKLGHHRQMAWYRWGIEKATGHRHMPVVVAAEKFPPFAVGAYKINDDVFVSASREFSYWLDMFAHCDAAQAWPAYSTDVLELQLPAWATQSEQPDDEPVEGW